MSATKYTGPIKSKKTADRIAAILEQEPGNKAKADAAALLRSRWQMVAARPELAAEFVRFTEGK